MTRAALARLSDAERDAHMRGLRRAEGVRYRAAHPEKSRAAKAKYKAAHPERVKESEREHHRRHRVKRVAYAIAWNAAHPEKSQAALRIARANYEVKHKDAIAARRRAKDIANPELRRAIRKRWSAAHPEHAVIVVERRRARKIAATVEPFTVADWRAICAYFGQRCAYCLRPGKLTQDHIVPLSRGGAHAIHNIVPACHTCNVRKSARTLPAFLLAGMGLTEGVG